MPSHTLSLSDMLLGLHPGVRTTFNNDVELSTSFANGVRVARKFIFDAQASRSLARLTVDHPNRLVSCLEDCHAPHEKTWVEFDNLSWHREISTSEGGSVSLHPDTAQCLGFLWEKGVLRFGFGSPNNESARSELRKFFLISPISYDVSKGWSSKEIVDFCQRTETTPVELASFLTGTTYNDLSVSERMDVLHSVRVEISSNFICTLSSKAWKGIWKTLRNECAGEFRTGIFALALLSHPIGAQIVSEVPVRKHFVRGKLKVLPSHTIVTVDLNSCRLFRPTGTGTGSEKRRHDVRGHFCHSGGDRYCDHSWVEHGMSSKTGEKQWNCSKCSMFRWWRVSHVRGNSLLGFVDHDYKVRG